MTHTPTTTTTTLLLTPQHKHTHNKQTNKQTHKQQQQHNKPPQKGEEGRLALGRPPKYALGGGAPVIQALVCVWVWSSERGVCCVVCVVCESVCCHTHESPRPKRRTTTTTKKTHKH